MFAVANVGAGDQIALHAMDARTGADTWGPVTLATRYGLAGLAYGDGRVYVITSDGALTAFTALDGAVVWRTALGYDTVFSSPPTYHGGSLFVVGGGGGGDLFAVDAGTGAVRWRQPVSSGAGSAPAVTDTGVYVSFSCDQAYGFAPSDGTPLWHHDTGCESFRGRTAVVGDGALWVRDDSDSGMPPVALNLSDGTERATFGTGPGVLAPVVHDGVGYFVDNGTLRASRTSDPTTPLWTFTTDTALTIAPVLVGGYLYDCSLGTLYAIDPATGAAVWSTTLASIMDPPDEDNPTTGAGLTAAAGHLLVPTADILSSYGR